MGHKYVKEEDTFSISQNGTVPKPTAQEVSDNKVLCANGSWVKQSGGGTNDYSNLINKPSINGVELNGNKSAADLGINIPTYASGSFSDVTTYWRIGATGSLLQKIGQIVVFSFNSTDADTDLPAGGFTFLGKVSFKPKTLVDEMLSSAYGRKLRLRIDTDGNINIYNYDSTGDMAAWRQIVYITDD